MSTRCFRVSAREDDALYANLNFSSRQANSKCDITNAATVPNSKLQHIPEMVNKTSKDDAYDVSDSTDWLETPLSSLTAVDSALRCQVCKDFYTTPMITSCAHTFCSLCIRRCLSNDGKCPACRTNDQELKLRFNGAMEELVQAFVKARPEVLEFARKPVVVSRSTSPKRSREEAGFEDNEEPSKRTRSSGRTKVKQKVVEVLDSDLDGDDDYMPGKFTGS